MTLRKKYVSMYDNAFDDVPELETLAVRDYATSAHHIYIIALQLERFSVDRDGFLDAIQSAGIGVAVHYVALHLQPYYVKNFNTKPQDYPIASNYSERVISLPLYPKMSSADVERVRRIAGVQLEFARASLDYLEHHFWVESHAIVGDFCAGFGK